MLKRLGVASVLAVFTMAAPLRAAQKPHRLRALDMGVYLASEFDAATTYYALRNCGTRCHELNPVLRPLGRNPGVFVLLGAGAYSVNYLARKLENRGHRRWAKAVRVLVIGVHAGAGVQNLVRVH